jgi:hypothetical protein
MGGPEGISVEAGGKCFTSEEDVQLIASVIWQLGQDGEIDWEAVAEMMPGRNAKQCRNRYCYHLVPGTGLPPLVGEGKQYFTPEENAQLIALVKFQLEQDGKVNWEAVAGMMPGRNAKQCKNRYCYHLVPGTNLPSLAVKRRFTPDEDAWLIASVELQLRQYGRIDWKAVAKEVPGRNARQCRERWLNRLDTDINHNSFTPEEDALLIKMVNKYGQKWSFFTRLFLGRTDVHLRNRYSLLMRRENKPGRRKVLFPDQATHGNPTSDETSCDLEQLKLKTSLSKHPKKKWRIDKSFFR